MMAQLTRGRNAAVLRKGLDMRWPVTLMVFAVGLMCVQHATTAQQVTVPDVAPEDVICFALYTVHENTLKLTAQLYPLPEGSDRTVRLEIEEAGAWVEAAESAVIEQGWTAPFRIENWDASQARRYRVAHGEAAFYEGTIRRDPVDEDVVTVVAFTGNSINERHGGDIPRTDIIENVKRIDPDLLFFSGDQVYNHKQHYAHWLKFGRDFGEIIRNYPTICIPDDHDVGHSNLWGEAGGVSKSQEGPDGGYFMPVEYVQEVERAQTSHLPDPYDPTPVQRGIGVYYTDLTWGRIGFAIIEDRKWKTGPEGTVPPMGPRPDHVTTPDYDPEALDVDGAVLLGERQLAFLNDWAQDWDGADMKAVLSQTIFCGGAHLHGKHDDRIYADLDSNGWPQSGRNRALRAIRKASAVMIAGDQHLGTIIHHGIDDWGDAGYSFCVPSIANLYLRWWSPLEPGKNRAPGMPEYTGEFLDGFNNKVTVWAVANPEPELNADLLTTRAAGFGVVHFNKPDRTITFECFPRNVDVTEAAQYPGWPKTVSQFDNVAASSEWRLPELQFEGVEHPVVQIVDESNGDIVYTVRANGSSFTPKVLGAGIYTVRVTRDSVKMDRAGLEAVRVSDENVPPINFSF
jgi:hypothetical protein